MTLVRYEPFGYGFGDRLSQLHRQIDRIFDNQIAANSDAGSSATADWIPPADIAEYADRFVLQFDVPGVDVGAIEITLDRGVLTLSGERRSDTVDKTDEKGIERSRRERPHGRFHRRFTLPDTVDAAAVRATGSNGVLQVTIPKQPKAQPRRIEVATA